MAKTWKKVSEGRRDDFGFLKIDIAQHSQISRANRQREVGRELNRFEAYVRERIESHDGRVWSWQGDGGLCAFLDYDKGEVDHTVRCGVDILRGLSQFNRKSKLREDIQVRIAMHLGRTAWRRNTGLIHSHAINFVSHLESRTPPDAIAISEDVHRECSDELRHFFRPAGDFEGTSVYVCDKFGLGLLRELKKIRDGISTLIEKLNRLRFKPDLVVGVGRSGGIVAAMLAGNMRVPSFVVLSRSVESNDERIVRPDDIVQLNVERIKKENKRVLLVFVEIRGGATFRAFTNLLRSQGVKDFRSATLFISSGAKRDYPNVFYAYEEEFDLGKAPWVIDEELWQRL